MKKRRVTLSLDEDIVEALESLEGRSRSAVVNKALRQAVELAAHRAALLEWLDELDERYGKATPEEQAENKAFLDEVFGPAEPEAGRRAGAA